MRDYSQPYPQAIFREKPMGFIEVYISKKYTYQSPYLDIDYLETSLYSPFKHGLETVALFLIKHKP